MNAIQIIIMTLGQRSMSDIKSANNCLIARKVISFLFRLIYVHTSHNNCLWGVDDNMLFITCVTVEGHIIESALMSIT